MSVRRFKIKTGRDQDISNLVFEIEKTHGEKIEQMFFNRNEKSNTVSLGIQGSRGILMDFTEKIRLMDFFVEEELVIGL